MSTNEILTNESTNMIMRLPGEIRNKIYTYLLVYKMPSGSKRRNLAFEGSGNMTRGLSPNILATERQVLHEARHFLYSRSHICLFWDHKMDEKERENKEDEFLVAIGTKNAALIEHVHVDIFIFCKVAEEDDVKMITWVPERVKFFAKLKELCTNLRTLALSARSINHITKSITHYSEEKVFDIWKKAYELLAGELQIFSSETLTEHPTEPLSKLAISVHSDDEEVWEHKQLLKGYWLETTGQLFRAGLT